MKKKSRKATLSLVELLAVFVLLVVTSGVLSIPGITIWKKRQFEHSVNKVMNRLQLAKQLALGYDTHVQVHLDETSSGYTCKLHMKERRAHLVYGDGSRYWNCSRSFASYF